jgi:hypothetical protein
MTIRALLLADRLGLTDPDFAWCPLLWPAKCAWLLQLAAQAVG